MMNIITKRWALIAEILINVSRTSKYYSSHKNNYK